jgi:putative flavoprotein involved in K+ transport
MASTASAVNVNTPTDYDSHKFDVVVIGAGQAGLSMGFYLKQHGLNFVILDARERVGDIWRSRWESLRLFTPAKYDGLPGLRFPAPAHHFPTSHEMADYLEAYAGQMNFPVRTGVNVDGLWPANDSQDGFVVTAGHQRFEADQVVVATGTFNRPKVPSFAGELDPRINQLHSSQYQRPRQLKEGGVLVVGAGNSGSEIALDASSAHRVILAGSDPGQIPIQPGSRADRVFTPVIWFLANHVLTVKTPIGRKVCSIIRSGKKAAPVERARRSVLEAAGVERIYARTVGVRDGLPLLDDGQVIDMPNVIWCTGFRSDFDWIHLPVVTNDGYPEQNRGVVPSVPGLYFIGLPFLYSFSSMLTGGVGRDARHIAKRIGSGATVTGRLEDGKEPRWIGG